ncbi:DUF2752 domain-containing protein [Soonwooa sp.]|uniref:DUF2752 domain-containing protein n=1 Tax=Soonwooa sp. TaxID=1938592 RepID=UPI002626B4EE|nr:DUF2752 domain-containing protein [Soonwooa sp.]
MKIKYVFGILVLGILLIYFFVNPANSGWALNCPFKMMTNYDCPGCGSQRAFHELLHGHFKNAFILNPLFVVAIPVFLIFLVFQIGDLKTKYSKFYNSLFGFKSILIYLIVIILFFVVRNTEVYHELIFGI